MKLVTFFLRNIQPYLDPVEFRSRNRLNTSSFPLDSSVTHGRKGIIKIRARLPVLPLGLFLQTDPEVLGILFHPTEIYIYIKTSLLSFNVLTFSPYPLLKSFYNASKSL